jgi:DNA-binding MarR family transcriptional regulator
MISRSERRNLAREILETLPRVMRLVGADLRRCDPPLDHATFRVMVMLGRRACNLSDLAARQGVSLPTMSRTVSTLVDRGWVGRTEEAADRRQVRLELTLAGRRFLARTHAQLLRTLSQSLGGLSADGARRVHDGLATLTHELEPAAAAGAEPSKATGRAPLLAELPPADKR